MHPILFQFGVFTIYSYGFFLALAYLIGAFIFWREGKKRGFKEERLIDFSILSLLAAIFGGRFFYFLSHYGFFSGNWSSFFAIWQGGFAYYGSVVFVFLLGIYLVRKWNWDFFQVADFAALSVLAAIILGKVGSFFAGNDYGSLTGFPWGVTAEFLEGKRHPVQLYEAFYTLILFIFLYRLYHKNLLRLGEIRSGSVFLYFLFLTSLGRIVFEQFRGDSSFFGPLRVSAVFALLLAAVSLGSLYYYQFRKFRSDTRFISRYLFGANLKIKNPFGKRV